MSRFEAVCNLSQVTVQPLWKQGLDRQQYDHAELCLRGAWLLDVIALPPRVCVTREERAGQTVLIISAAQPLNGGDSQE